MRGDWKDWRPAIWLAMLGVAVALLVNPWYIAAIPFGAAIGAAIRIQQRRRRAAAPTAGSRPSKPPKPGAGGNRKRRGGRH
jgi:hypothetical protein